MRKVEMPQVIPAQITKVVSYVCDAAGCSFSTPNDHEAQRHHGKEHAIKETRYINGTTFYRFESKEDMDSWFQASGYNVFDGTWVGPGWYAESCGDRPCPRSCCTDSWVELTHINSYEEQVRCRLRDLIGELRELRVLKTKEGT